MKKRLAALALIPILISPSPSNSLNPYDFKKIANGIEEFIEENYTFNYGIKEQVKKDIGLVQQREKEVEEINEIKSIEKPEEVRGIYLTADSAVRIEKFIAKIETLPEGAINSLVIDVKESNGVHYKKYDLEGIVKKLHEKGIYVIARQVVFKDYVLAKNKPELKLGSREGAYVNPASEEVQKYNINIAKDVISKGVDEIQFDYVRFPDDCLSVLNKTKIEVISGFLEKANKELKGARPEIKISADIFGYVCWNYDMGIGQNIERMAQFVDILCPMAYPSHYSVEDRPLGAYKLIYKTSNKAKERLEKAGIKTEIRPWIQGFTWRTPDFNKEYILEQIKASRDSNSQGFCIWNASNTYTTSLEALKDLPIKIAEIK